MPHSKRCVAPGCEEYADDSVTTAVFRFPRDSSRCRTWVQNCGNRDLLLLPVEKLHKLRFLCGKHFEPQHFFDKYRRKLHRNAVPTIFSGSGINAEEMARFDRMVCEHVDAGQGSPVDTGEQSPSGVEPFNGVVCSTPGSLNMHQSQQGMYGHLSSSHVSGFAVLDNSLTEGEYSQQLPAECLEEPFNEGVSCTPGPSNMEKKMQGMYGYISSSHRPGLASLIDIEHSYQLPNESREKPFDEVVSSTPEPSNMQKKLQGHNYDGCSIEHSTSSHLPEFAVLDASLTEEEHSHLHLFTECREKSYSEAVSSTPGPSNMQKRLQGHISASHLTGFAVLDASFTQEEDSQLPSTESDFSPVLALGKRKRSWNGHPEQEALRNIEMDRIRRRGKNIRAITQEYCTMCDLHFFGNIVAHRKQDSHQALKKFLHPCCAPCGKEFHTRIEWDEHKLSPEHMKKCPEGGDDLKLDTTIELDDFELETKVMEEILADNAEDGASALNIRRLVPKYNPDAGFALKMVVPATGFECPMCKSFFIDEETVSIHCRTKTHFDNYVAYEKRKAKRVSRETKPIKKPRLDVETKVEPTESEGVENAETSLQMDDSFNKTMNTTTGDTLVLETDDDSMAMAMDAVNTAEESNTEGQKEEDKKE